VNAEIEEAIMIWNAEEFCAPELSLSVKAGQKLLEATTALQMHSIKALFRCQIEAASFLRRRFWDDLKLIETLRDSDEFADSFDVFANFWQNAASDYLKEVGEFACIGAKLAMETAGQVRKEADTAIDDMAAATLTP
jgi:hypothetical protein